MTEAGKLLLSLLSEHEATSQRLLHGGAVTPSEFAAADAVLVALEARIDAASAACEAEHAAKAGV